MNKRVIKWCVLIVVVLLITSLLLWRFWPRSLDRVLPADIETVSTISCSANITEIESGIDNYVLKTASQGSEDFQAIIDILNAGGYRPDFRNFFRKLMTSAESGKEYDGRVAHILFHCGDTSEETVYVTFSKGLIVVSTGDDSGFLFYHPVSDDVFEDLMDYIQTNGVKAS